MITHFIDHVCSKVIHFIIAAPVNIGREQWIYIFFALVLFGFLCMRGMGLRSY